MENSANPTQDEQNSNQNHERRQGLIPTDNSLKDAINTAKKVFKVARRVGSILSNPAFFIPIIIIIIILIVFFFGASAAPMGGGEDATPTPPAGGTTTVPSIPGLTITLTGLPSVDNGVNIPYTITITYDKSVATTPLENIELFDIIPPNASFVSTTGTEASNSTHQILVWSLRDAANQQSFALTLHPESADSYVTNTISARISSLSSSGTVTPTTNDCNDPNYRRFMDMTTDHLNFGDPNCEVTDSINDPVHRDLMYSYIKNLDPVNASIWYYCISYNESRWIPVAYLGSSTSGLGAYGLFQMNPDGRGNGQYDSGNVYWKQQMENAVNYNNKSINSSFDYWRGNNPNVIGTGSSLTCAKPQGPGA